MICKVHIEATKCSCGLKSRNVLFAWGCVKLATTIVLLLYGLFLLGQTLMGMVYYWQLFFIEGIIVYGVSCVLSITDLIYQSMLIYGLHKNKVNLLMRYINYSKALWVLTPILGFVYAIIYLKDLLWISPPWSKSDMMQLMFIHIICIMLISLVFQTFAIRAARSEIAKLDNKGTMDDENDDKPRRFNAEFILKIETSNIEEQPKKDKDLEVIETACEKAKLIE